jgi:multiple sugar transport system permease protein
MPAIVLLAVWKNFGYATILFVAGLQAIPESLYEAARLEAPGPCRCSARSRAAARSDASSFSA